MKFGVCAGYQEGEHILSWGYDYIELNLCQLAQIDDATFTDMRQTLEKAGIQAESFNGFFPGDLHLVGPEADFEKIAAHAELALRRAAQLGGKVAVLGSGRSRRIPEGVSAEEGWEQFKKAAVLCADIAQKYGMVVAIEPLNTNETNLVNTVADGLRLCREAGHPALTLLADYYHVFKSGETMDAIVEAGSLLTHVHIARPANDRGCPAPDQEELFAPFFAALQKNGYTGRVSLECNCTDFPTQIPAALPMLKKLV